MCVCLCVCFEPHCVCLYEKVDGCLVVFLAYVCVGTTFLSMLGQFEVLMVMPETQCECCVVSVTVCVCVSVCVFQGNHCV